MKGQDESPAPFEGNVEANFGGWEKQDGFKVETPQLDDDIIISYSFNGVERFKFKTSKLFYKASARMYFQAGKDLPLKISSPKTTNAQGFAEVFGYLQILLTFLYKKALSPSIVSILEFYLVSFPETLENYETHGGLHVDYQILEILNASIPYLIAQILPKCGGFDQLIFVADKGAGDVQTFKYKADSIPNYVALSPNEMYGELCNMLISRFGVKSSLFTTPSLLKDVFCCLATDEKVLSQSRFESLFVLDGVRFRNGLLRLTPESNHIAQKPWFWIGLFLRIITCLLMRAIQSREKYEYQGMVFITTNTALVDQTDLVNDDALFTKFVKMNFYQEDKVPADQMIPGFEDRPEVNDLLPEVVTWALYVPERHLNFWTRAPQI